ncbi:hypothetical protein CRUP_020509, partial [Coryphaenoides rupestris]
MRLLELRCSLQLLWWGLCLLLRLKRSLLQRLRPVDGCSMMWLLVSGESSDLGFEPMAVFVVVAETVEGIVLYKEDSQVPATRDGVAVGRLLGPLLPAGSTTTTTTTTRAVEGRVEQERAELRERWRAQLLELQRQGGSLGTALRQIDSTQNHMVDLTDRLDRYLRQPKDVTSFTLAGSTLSDIQELEDSIQSELDQLARLDSVDSGHLASLSREVASHRASLDQLSQQVRKSEAAARALDRFLMSLRSVETDISGAQGTPPGDPLLQDPQAQLGLSRRSVASLRDKAPQLDVLLQGARLVLKAQHSELQTLSDLHRGGGGGGGAEEHLQPLKSQWEKTQASVNDRLEESRMLMELLKKFQGCRGYVSSTIQKAEQVIGQQASYLGKDNLHRLIAKVQDMKAGLSGVGGRMEEMRGVCRQLQSHLKKLPDCGHAPFEAESDALMDSWLDDEIQEQEGNLEHFHRKSVEIQEMLQTQEPPLELQKYFQGQMKYTVPPQSVTNIFLSIMFIWYWVIETQLRKRMEQVQELFSDSTDVFEELLAVQKQLAEKIQQCAAAVENIQNSVNQDLSEDLDFQEDKAQAVMKELGLISSVASHRVLEPLTQDTSRLHDSFSLTRELIQRRRDDQGKDLLTALRDDSQRFDQFFQDLQLSINECFENPESREDVETSLNRLMGFLDARESERRLAQLRERLAGGREQIPPTALEELTSWLEEQEKEVPVFTTHCANRQRQMQNVLNTFDSLQEQYDVFRDWVQNKEKDSLESDQVSRLLKDLQDQRRRAESLGDLLASVRRQGVRGDSLLKDGDNLLQRYRNLETRLQDQHAQAQKALDRQREDFHSQAESTQAWIGDLAQGLVSARVQGRHHEVKQAAQAVLDSKSDGDDKVEDLRSQGQSVCACEDLEESRRTEVQQAVREAEERWRKVLEKAGESLHTAERQAVVEEKLNHFKTQKESVLSWVRQQNQNLRSLGGHMTFEERLQIPQNILASEPAGDAKIQDLHKLAQTLCEDKALEEEEQEDGGRRRQEVRQALQEVEAQWAGLLRGAREAERSGLAEVFHLQKNETLAWLAERQRDVLGSRPEGDRQVNDLRRGGQCLCGRLDQEDSRRREEVQQAVQETEDRWRLVLQGARQMLEEADSQVALETEKRDRELREFDSHNQEATMWIGALQQKLTALAEQTSTEDRLHTAQSILGARTEGDAKMADLQTRVQALCENQDLDESTGREVRGALRGIRERWAALLASAKRAVEEGERRRDLEGLLGDVQTQRRSTAAWLEQKEQALLALDSQGDPEVSMHTAQGVLASKPEGDGRVEDLRRRGRGVCAREDLEESRRTEVQQAVGEAEERWRKVLEKAEESLHRAELQYSLSRELEAFRGQERNAGDWVDELQCQAESLGDPTLLGSRSKGESFLSDLSRRAQSLLGREDLEESRRQEVQRAVRQMEERWRPLLLTAEEAQRYGTRTEALFDTTQDPTWRDPTLAGMDSCLPGLISELAYCACFQEAGADLELGILTERQFTQLVEQHGAAQDWLREQVRHLHDLRTASEREVRQRLAACEARLGELEQEAGRRSRALRERGAALQWELRSLDQALSYSQPQNRVDQLQHHWASLQAALAEGEKLQFSLREALSHQEFLVACLKAGEADRLEKESAETLQAAVSQSSALTQILK